MTSLPNLITWARLLAAPLTVWLLLEGRDVTAFWLFLAAGSSDLLDGWLAKRLNARSEFGARLDPLADKALVGAVYLALGWMVLIPPWLVVMVIARDLTILAGVGVLMACRRLVQARPSMLSKINTGLQLALVTFVLATRALPGLDGVAGDAVIWILVGLTALTTLASGVAYAIEWLRLMGAGVGQTP